MSQNVTGARTTPTSTGNGTKSGLLFIFKVLLRNQHFGWWKYFTPKSKQNVRCFIWKLLLLGVGKMALWLSVLFVLLWGSDFRSQQLCNKLGMASWVPGEPVQCVGGDRRIAGTGWQSCWKHKPSRFREGAHLKGREWWGGCQMPSSGLYSTPSHIGAHTTLSYKINCIKFLLYFTPMFIMEVLLSLRCGISSVPMTGRMARESTVWSFIQP